MTSLRCCTVSPLEDLLDTAKDLYLKDFRKAATRANLEHMLLQDGEAFTLFVPTNKAFVQASRETR